MKDKLNAIRRRLVHMKAVIEDKRNELDAYEMELDDVIEITNEMTDDEARIPQTDIRVLGWRSNAHE